MTVVLLGVVALMALAVLLCGVSSAFDSLVDGSSRGSETPLARRVPRSSDVRDGSTGFG